MAGCTSAISPLASMIKEMNGLSASLEDLNAPHKTYQSAKRWGVVRRILSCRGGIGLGGVRRIDEMHLLSHLAQSAASSDAGCRQKGPAQKQQQAAKQRLLSHRFASLRAPTSLLLATTYLKQQYDGTARLESVLGVERACKCVCDCPKLEILVWQDSEQPCSLFRAKKRHGSYKFQALQLPFDAWWRRQGIVCSLGSVFGGQKRVQVVQM